jgi:hypothetical protein
MTLGNARRIRFAISLLSLLLLSRSARAYGPDEARAIVLDRPESLPSSSPGVVLASQRILTLSGGGGATEEDYLFYVIGPARPPGPVCFRWTYRPEVEQIKVIDARVHKLSGVIVPIPPESLRIEPCAAAGPKGYPGLADLVVRVPDPVTCDLVEIHTTGEEAPTLEPQYYVGEEHFAEGDSVVEAELQIIFPTALSLFTMNIGKIPAPEQIAMGTSYQGRWLLGHLSPAAPVHFGIASRLTDAAPDTAGPPGLLFGYRNDWQTVSAMRGYEWKRVLATTPAELSGVAGRIYGAGADPHPRADSALAWVNRRLGRVDIPVTRLWYIPSPLEAILDRGAAIPRDRAAILVALLNLLGIKADAAMVRHDRGFAPAFALPQQLDVWVVRIHFSPTDERWLDMRDPASAVGNPLPAGQALVWTVRREEPALVPFPGISP